MKYAEAIMTKRMLQHDFSGISVSIMDFCDQASVYIEAGPYGDMYANYKGEFFGDSNPWVDKKLRDWAKKNGFQLYWSNPNQVNVKLKGE